MIEQQNLLAAAKRLGELFRSRFEQLRQQCDLVREVRVRGVMIGIELADRRGRRSSRPAWSGKLLINCTHGTVIRLLPAMTLTEEQAHAGCDILADVLKHRGAA